MENENYQAIPGKYKLLIGIAAAAVLMSDTCTQMWTKMAKANGVNVARSGRVDWREVAGAVWHGRYRI